MRIDKHHAIRLRQEGKSYALIAEQLNIPKSTLSNWLKDVPYTPSKEVLQRIKNGQGTYGLRRNKQRLQEIATLKETGILEVGTVTKRDLWMLGLGLWIGEGSKTIEQIRLVNADPRVIKLFMRWLREVCELTDENITVAMHLYPDSDESLSKRYWMTITGLPEKQFRKTQIDRRLGKQELKLGKLAHGTLHVTVASNGNSEKGVRLYRRMMGWVAGVMK